MYALTQTLCIHTTHTTGDTSSLIDRNLLILLDAAVMGVGPGRVGIKLRVGVGLVHSSTSMKVGKKRLCESHSASKLFPSKYICRVGNYFPSLMAFPLVLPPLH